MASYFFYLLEPNVPFVYLTPMAMVGQFPAPYPTKMSPAEYLEFAITDLAEGSARGLVNAFGNAKRSLHLAVDILLNQYGLFKCFGHGNFPSKLRRLDDIGLLPVRIMKNLNVERNLIEHEYDVPARARVEEAVDVVRLLLLATDRLLEANPVECVVGWRTPPRHLILRLDPPRGEITLTSFTAKGQFKILEGVSCFTGRLRTLVGASKQGIRIAKKPWRTIPVDLAHSTEWLPIVRELVAVRRKNSARMTHVDPDSAEATIPVTIPLHSLGSRTWASVMDEFLDKKFESSADTAAPSDTTKGS